MKKIIKKLFVFCLGFTLYFNLSYSTAFAAEAETCQITNVTESSPVVMPRGSAELYKFSKLYISDYVNIDVTPSSSHNLKLVINSSSACGIKVFRGATNLESRCIYSNQISGNQTVTLNLVTGCDGGTYRIKLISNTGTRVTGAVVQTQVL